MKDLDYVAPGADTGGWKDRHKRFLDKATPTRWGKPFKYGTDAAIARAIDAWCGYAQAHQSRYNSAIGEDYVLGPAWEQWGRSLRTLLNGETGDLDCGALDSIILDNLADQGFGEE